MNLLYSRKNCVIYNSYCSPYFFVSPRRPCDYHTICCNIFSCWWPIQPMLYIIAKSVTLYSVYGEQLLDDCIAAGGWPFRVSYRMAKKRLNFAVITFRKFSLWYRDRLAKSSASPNQIIRVELNNRL